MRRVILQTLVKSIPITNTVIFLVIYRIRRPFGEDGSHGKSFLIGQSLYGHHGSSRHKCLLCDFLIRNIPESKPVFGITHLSDMNEVHIFMDFILLAIGMAVVVVGFILMSGAGSSETAFNPDIFSVRRVKVAPAVCLLGFLFIIYAILRKPADLPAEE